MSRTEASGRAIGLVLTGLLIGGVLATPAGAHLGSFTHLKKHFYTKTAANTRFVNECVDEVQVLGHGIVDEGLVTASFDDNALSWWVSCWGAVRVRQIVEGHYQVDFAAMSNTSFPNVVPIVQVSGIGEGVNASYKWTNAPTIGVVIDVWLKDLAGNPSSSDFSFALLNVLDGPGFTPTRVLTGGFQESVPPGS
jgi:hypothetical protein